MPPGDTNADRGAAAPGIRPALSRAIRTLRLPLMAGPLFVHACLAPERSLPQFVLARVLGDIAVPAFFFISGLLYFAAFDGTARAYFGNLARRLRSLAVPYLLWNLIGYLLLAHAVHMVAKGDFLRSFWAVRVEFRGVASAPVDGPLYFIKGLYFLAIGAPALLFCLRRATLAWLAPAALLFWVVSPVAALSGRMAAIALAFFSCGGYVALRAQPALEKTATDRRAAFAAAALFALVSAANVAAHAAGCDSAILRRANVAAGVPFAFAAAGALGDGRAARLLARGQGFAMFLYCSFDLAIAYMRKVWRPLRDPSDATCLRVALLAFGVSLALYLAVSLVAPPLAALLTGGRQRQNRRVVEEVRQDRRGQAARQ